MTSHEMREEIFEKPRQWLLSLSRAMVKWAMRHGLPIQDMIDVLKKVYVEVAAEDLRASGEQVNASRISASTGVHRRDVMRFIKGEPAEPRSKGLLSRIITHWSHDKKFCSKAGKPKPLTYQGQTCEFASLVSEVSSDLDFATVLFQMERQNLLVRDSKTVSLVARVYAPHGDPDQGFQLLSSDIEDLMTSVEGNLFHRTDPPNLHAKTQFDNIALSAVPLIREWFFEEGKKLHQQARAFLAQYDLDINRTAEPSQGGARVVLGTFSAVEMPPVAPPLSGKDRKED